jgi:hypothetical protein
MPSNLHMWAHELQTANRVAANVVANMAYICHQLDLSARDPGLAIEAQAQQARLMRDLQLDSDGLLESALRQWP